MRVALPWGRLVAAALTIVACDACNAVAALNDLEFDAGSGGAASTGGSGGSLVGGSGGAGGAACSDDTDSDPQHCGECGHSCLGGDCVSGRCRPVVIADGQDSPLHVAANATSVYWSSFVPMGSVRRMDRTTDIISLVVTGAGRPSYLALTDTHLYWCEYEGDVVVRSALDGTDREIVAAAPEVDLAYGVAVDGDTIYWNNGGSAGAVRRSTIGGTPTDVISSLDAPEGLWLHRGALYLAEENRGALTRYRLPDGPLEVIAEGLGDPVGIAADDDYVYYTDQTGGELLRIAQPTGPAEILVSGMEAAGGVFVTDDAVYFTDLAGGTIHMLAK